MRALNRPTAWWGWHWEPPVPMSIIELIAAGNMDTRTAALFWIAMEHGASVIIAAEPPSSGKTTTLSALMSFTKPETAVYFTSGVGEQFLLPTVSQSYDTYILINEMSDHIPVYTWDDNARRAFELLSKGYRMGTTMHDTTVQGVLGQLEKDLAIPRSHLANLTCIVPMYIGRGANGPMRRVQGIAFVQATGDGYKLSSLVEWQPETDTFEVFGDQPAHEAFIDWLQTTPAELANDMEKRVDFLETLLSTGVSSVTDVGEAIVSYYEQMTGNTYRRATEG